MTIAIRFAYDERVIKWVREQPKDKRTWDAVRKQWRLTEETYDEFKQQFPSIKHIATPVVESAVNEYVCEYVSRPKYSFPSSRVVSYGWKGGFITIAISMEALEAFFRVGTLYDVLAIDPTATNGDIKDAYRRLARQWHPDVCREENAQEQFIRIKHAYDILSGTQRKKYDFGLQLFGTTQKKSMYPGCILPLRCGVISGEVDTNVKPTITKINSWKDIVDETGRVMVSNWRGDSYVTEWVDKGRF